MAQVRVKKELPVFRHVSGNTFHWRSPISVGEVITVGSERKGSAESSSWKGRRQLVKLHIALDRDYFALKSDLRTKCESWPRSRRN